MLRRVAVLVLLSSAANAFTLRRAALPRPIRARAAGVSPPPLMICPLAPLAPIWAVGKAIIVARRRLFPDAEPWPRAWEESDIWLDKTVSFDGLFGDAPAEASKATCPVPPERRKGGARPAAAEGAE